jgi:hypothetical protein
MRHWCHLWAVKVIRLTHFAIQKTGFNNALRVNIVLTGLKVYSLRRRIPP